MMNANLGADDNDGTSASRKDIEQLTNTLLAALGILFCAAAAALSGNLWVKSAGLVLLTGMVGLACGAGLGFLFGIPRSAQPTSSRNGPGANGDTVQSHPNTNLEELSDWLTKIIVGLGLAQLYQLGFMFNQFRSLVALYTPPEDHVTPLVASLTLVFGLVCGFLWLYLQTRTIVSHILDTFDRALVSKLKTALSGVASRLPGGGVELAPVADALKSAARLDPADSSLRSSATKALAAAGRTEEAAAILPAPANSTLNDRLGRMLVALYRPGGYVDAINLAQQLETDSAATARSDYWVYRACAYGQKFKSIDPEKTKVEGDAARKEVIDCAKRAIAINPFEKVRLFRLAHPERFDRQEDDLAAFAADAEFMNIVGDAAKT